MKTISHLVIGLFIMLAMLVACWSIGFYVGVTGIINCVAMGIIVILVLLIIFVLVTFIVQIMITLGRNAKKIVQTKIRNIKLKRLHKVD